MLGATTFEIVQSEIKVILTQSFCNKKKFIENFTNPQC